MNRGWIYVALTCTFELIWVYGFNVASTLWHWIIMVTLIIIDFSVLAKACEYLPTGTVYAVFAGVGTVGATLMDVFLFGAELTGLKILFIALLALGVIGLERLEGEGEENVQETVAQKMV